MEFLHLPALPIKNPVIIFAIVLFVILLSPIVLKKFKIPGLVGLIISGMLLGPHGFYILERDSSIILFGTVGLLYIMFMAGIELDFAIFRRNRSKSIVFGFYTFIFPLIFGFLATHYILNLSFLASLLTASMFATHTLVSYPIASRLGILKNDVVGIAVGGTIFTDTAVLILLAVITKSFTGQLSFMFWVQLMVSLAIFMTIVIYLFPIITKWFFKNIEPESVWQYIFILAMLFTASFLAELAGVEPIIGAFFAGLSLNKLIPHNSALMDKIDFVGNAIFIPFFLISVGMIVDLKVLATGYEAIIFALVLSIVAIVTKWLAAYTTGLTYKLSTNQVNLLFGLTSSHAAATLAVIIVGFNIGLLDNNVLNGTIVLILITCITSSFVTENYGRRIALNQKAILDSDYVQPQRILVPVANPENIKSLIEFGLHIKETNSNEMIYSLMIFDDDKDIAVKMNECRVSLDKAAKAVSPKLHNKIQLTSRIDISPSVGVLKAAKELLITDIVIGISNKRVISDFLFGNIGKNIVNENSQSIYIIKLINPLNTIDKVYVFMPEYAELEVGFENVLATICRFGNNIGAEIKFCCFENTSLFLRQVIKKHKITAAFSIELAEELNNYNTYEAKIEHDDMIIMFHSRSKGISYNPQYDKLLHSITNKFNNNDVAIVYPEQSPVINTEGYTKFDILDSSPVGESVKIVDKIKELFAKR
ncbi:MAG TPA: cation:proton antiporter [Candidatus Kapabacteria bacterium]|nr:cation:proton antiporter [Candidatus Kapabacteria bacterium]